MGGLGQPQTGALGRVQEAVQEAGGKRDVVVHDEQPVVGRQVVAGEERVEVLELPALSGRREVDRHVVAAALQLGARLRHEPGHVGAVDAEHEYAPPGPAGGRARQATAPAAQGLAGIQQGVERGAQPPAPAADGAAVAGQEVVAARRRPAAARAPGQRPQSPRAVRGHDRPVGAAEAQAVERAAGEDPQLGAERRRGAADDVEAPAGLPPAVSRAGERTQPGVVARPAMVQRGRGDVADPPADRPPTGLPLLLVAVELTALVEPADAFDRAAADRHVGAPRAFRVRVCRPEVHGGHRRPLAPASAEGVVFEPGVDGACEDADLAAARVGGAQ
jgi:hypothetical protein